MPLIDTVKQRIEDARERRPLLDHLVRTVQHFGDVNGSALAAAVTYFAFLSFFPIIALAFAVVGFVSGAYPNAERDLETAINDVLPGIVGDGAGELSLDSLQSSASGIATVGLLVALYSGLGWLSGMRTALVAVFEEPEKEQPNFFLGKLRDVIALLTLGTVLLLSVAISGVATKLATPILEFLGLGLGVEPLVWVLGLALGLAASTVLFFAFFRVLAAPERPAEVAVVRRAARGAGLRGPQAAVDLPAGRHQGRARRPGVRDRAHPGRLDELLLPGRGPRRRLGARVPGRPRAA